MKIVRLFKKFRNLTHTEAKSYALALAEGVDALEVVSTYLAIQVDAIDKELSNTKVLYERTGADLYVATLLARREVNYNLLLLLQKKVELDVDQTKD